MTRGPGLRLSSGFFIPEQIPPYPVIAKIGVLQRHNAEASSDLATVTQELDAFIQTLESGFTAGTVGDHAYWLLKVNAEYIQGKIP